MADAVTACVHCGFCLPSCPTYQELGEEMDSPRGRIYLMKGVLEGSLDPEQVQPHIDRCLGCMACETACPSGVRYHELLLPYRALAKSRDRSEATVREAVTMGSRRSNAAGLRRWLTMQTLPYPARFRAAVRAGRMARWLGKLVPASMQPLLELLPRFLPETVPMPVVTRAIGQRRARVALSTGCVQSVLEPAINQATVAVLTRNGVEVVIPHSQSCCGALDWHTGDVKRARTFARRNFRAFPRDVDAIVVNAAGCASAMLEYPLSFKAEPDEATARDFAAKVVDVSVFLDGLGMEAPPAPSSPLRVAVHDACHLCHAQQVRAEPRNLLRAIAGIEILELNDDERCCGSAGIYNIDQPQVAAALGRRKAGAIRATDCDVVATGNIGCIIQMQRHLADSSVPPPPVLHTVQILAAAYASTLDEFLQRAPGP
jgi:glycolate oxidase iron-sulfur subunit